MSCKESFLDEFVWSAIPPLDLGGGLDSGGFSLDLGGGFDLWGTLCSQVGVDCMGEFSSEKELSFSPPWGLFSS